jgi:hypothetical protein
MGIEKLISTFPLINFVRHETKCARMTVRDGDVNGEENVEPIQLQMFDVTYLLVKIGYLP